MTATIAERPDAIEVTDAGSNYDLLMESLSFQCDYAQRVLGIREPEIAEVLRDMAEWYGGDRSQWQTVGATQ